MSQSDYIKYKRVAQELKVQSKLSPILDAGKYMEYKEFSLENSITSDSARYDKLIPIGIPVVFGMERSCASACPEFLVCRNTDSRPNRHPLGASFIGPFQKIPSATSLAARKNMGMQYCRCVV